MLRWCKRNMFGESYGRSPPAPLTAPWNLLETTEVASYHFIKGTISLLLLIVNDIERYSGHAQVWSSTQTSARLIFLSLLCKNGPEQRKQRANLARGRVNTGQTSFSHPDSHLPLADLQPSSGRGCRLLSLRQQKKSQNGMKETD